MKYRESDCQALYERWADGSLRNLQRIACLRERAEARIKALASFAEQP